MPTSTIAVFTSSDRPIALENAEIPALQRGEILVGIEYTTLCRSDLNTYCGKRMEKSPTILGHEIAGRIIAFGPGHPETDVRGEALLPGDRISWAIYASSPDSEMAQRGMPQKAADLFKYGHEAITAESNLHGGLSEYIILREHTPVAKISENVPVQVAAIINCAVATVAGALRQAGMVRGKKVLVLGAGMLGAIACAMSKTLGAASVAAIDIDVERLEAIRHYGADTMFLTGEDVNFRVSAVYGDARPFDVVLELTGVTSAMHQGLNLLAIGGTAIWVGATYPQAPVMVDGEMMVRRLLTIKGLHNYNTDDFRAAVDFIEQHHTDFPFREMIHDEFTLNEVNEAFAYALSANPFRVGIKIK